jgi:hypothetical protein
MEIVRKKVDDCLDVYYAVGSPDEVAVVRCVEPRRKWRRNTKKYSITFLGDFGFTTFHNVVGRRQVRQTILAWLYGRREA